MVRFRGAKTGPLPVVIVGRQSLGKFSLLHFAPMHFLNELRASLAAHASRMKVG